MSIYIYPGAVWSFPEELILQEMKEGMEKTFSPPSGLTKGYESIPGSFQMSCVKGYPQAILEWFIADVCKSPFILMIPQ